MSQPVDLEFDGFGSSTTADEVLTDLDLSGRTMIVTGANTGIGFETARALAAAGARVILGCRDAGRGKAAVDRILQAHPGAAAELSALDLASFTSVRNFAQRIDAPVDALICNAGVVNTDYRETESSFEHTVGTSHLGHFLLTQQLLPRLLEEGGGRVVMVSSESHRTPRKLDFDRLPLSAKDYSMMVAYGQAKLCNVLFANELQRRYGAQGLVACSLHPGTMVTTDIARGSALGRIVMALISPFTKNANQGAATSVWCAVHPEPELLGGGYFSSCQPKQSTAEANDPDVARRLWEQTEAWIG